MLCADIISYSIDDIISIQSWIENIYNNLGVCLTFSDDPKRKYSKKSPERLYVVQDIICEDFFYLLLFRVLYEA